MFPSVPQLFCVLTSLSPEVALPALSFPLTDIPLLPGSPRRLSPRAVARGSQGDKQGQQHLKVPDPPATGLQGSSNQDSGQLSDEESSHNSSVSTGLGGMAKGSLMTGEIPLGRGR